MKKERIIVSILNIKLEYTSVPEIIAKVEAKFQRKTKCSWHNWYTYRTVKWKTELAGFPLRPMSKPEKLTDGEYEEICNFLEKKHMSIRHHLKTVFIHDLSGLQLNRSCNSCCDRVCNSCERK
jgi:hypothetical protein